MTASETFSAEAALKEYQDDAARCCDSCEKTAQRDECKVAFQHGWNKAIFQERRRTEELEKEVERLQQECDSLNIRRESLVLERDAAIERAEALEIEKRYNWEGIKLHYQEEILKLREEKAQALALAKGYGEALRCILYQSRFWDLGSTKEKLRLQLGLYETEANKALSASPTSLLERFKADERIIEEAKTVASDFKDSSHWVALRDALEELEKLK